MSKVAGELSKRKFTKGYEGLNIVFADVEARAEDSVDHAQIGALQGGTRNCRERSVGEILGEGAAEVISQLAFELDALDADGLNGIWTEIEKPGTESLTHRSDHWFRRKIHPRRDFWLPSQVKMLVSQVSQPAD